MDFSEQLIEEVKKFECLYNLQLADYKSNQKKDIIWQNIARALNANADDCKKKWKNLRDAYRRHMQRQQLSSGSAAPCSSKMWKFALQMSFLQGVESHRSTISNLCNEEMVDDISIEDVSHSPQPKRKRTNSGCDRKFEEFMNAATAKLAEIRTEVHQKTSTSLLFEALAQKVNEANLSAAELADVELKVTTVVNLAIKKSVE